MSAREVPVLFLIFNRPESTQRVFESLRLHKPRHLFVASDGARNSKPGEAEIVQRTREIASKVDWDCEVKTLFRSENLGCGLAVSSAISWFFEQVEEGIILEDDCLPHPDFFTYCATLLERYRHEPRVATISGTHFLPAVLHQQQTHYSSKYFQMWGWATWRRTWKNYDYTLASLNDDQWWVLLQKTHNNPTEAKYWREIYRALKAGGINTWDFQVFFSAWRHSCVHLIPSRNLVSNIGYGPDATHTNFASPMANLPVYPLRLSNEPIPLEPDREIDGYIFFLRFLESLTQTWWVEQVFSPEEKLGHARTEIIRKDRRIRELENEVKEKRRQLLAATRELANTSALSNTCQ